MKRQADLQKLQDINANLKEMIAEFPDISDHFYSSEKNMSETYKVICYSKCWILYPLPNAPLKVFLERVLFLSLYIFNKSGYLQRAEPGELNFQIPNLEKL